LPKRWHTSNDFIKNEEKENRTFNLTIGPGSLFTQEELYIEKLKTMNNNFINKEKCDEDLMVMRHQ
jgi:hypothetical protein